MDRRGVSLRLGLRLGGAGTAGAAYPSTASRLEVSHGETMPNPGYQADTWAVQSGDWDDPATWAAGVPVATDKFYIGDTLTVTVRDQAATAASGYVADGGELAFDPAENTRLTVTTLAVHGTLRMGTPGGTAVAADKTCEVVIRDTALPGQATDWHQFSNGVLVLNGATWRRCGAEKTHIARLAADPVVGQDTLELEAAPTGWRVGDRVGLPFTSPANSTTQTLGDVVNEEFVVLSVVGTTVALDHDIEYTHRGVKDKTGATVRRAHLINFTRNVRIRSENAAGTRGHTLFTGRADVDLRWTELRGLGRTTGELLNSTTVTSETAGGVTSYGTNQVGRYPEHAHHCFGPVNGTSEADPGTGYQLHLEGNVTDDCRKWGVVLHGTSYAYVKDCVAWDYQAAGFSYETGGEWFNHMEGCLAANGSNAGHDQIVCNSFWILSASRNTFLDLVCAANLQPFTQDGFGFGFTSDSYLGHGFHYDAPNRGAAGSTRSLFNKKPLYRGADVVEGTEGEEYDTVAALLEGFEDFDGIEGYGLAKLGSFDHIAGGRTTLLHVKNATAWHTWSDAWFVYGGAGTRVFFEDFNVYGWAEAAWQPSTWEAQITVDGGEWHVHADVAGQMAGFAQIGVLRPGTAAGRDGLVIKNVDIHCPVCVVMKFRGSDGANDVLADEPISALIPVGVMATDGVTTSNPTWSGSAGNRRYSMGVSGDNLSTLAKMQCFVLNFEGTPGEHYQLFWDEQDPDELSPVGILTNQELYDQDGRAWGGELMPVGAATETWLALGKALPITPPEVTAAAVHEFGGKILLTCSGYVCSPSGHEWWNGSFPGFTVTASGGAVTATYKVRASVVQFEQNGYYTPTPDNVICLDLSRPIAAGETVTFDFDGAGGVEAMPGVGLLMEAVNDMAVTNSSTNDGTDELALGLERDWLLDETGPGARLERVYPGILYPRNLVDVNSSVGSDAGIDGDGLAAEFDNASDLFALAGHFDGGTLSEKFRSDYTLWGNDVTASAPGFALTGPVAGQLWVYLDEADAGDLLSWSDNTYGPALMIGTGGSFKLEQVSTRIETATGVATTGVWHHLMWSYNPDTTTIRLWHNGTPVTPVVATLSFAAGAWRVGSSVMRGRAAWARIWHRDVDIDDVTAAFAARPDTDSPYLLHNFRDVITGAPI